MSNRSTIQPLTVENRISASSKQCPVGQDLAALGKRWTFHILRSIAIQRVERFNQLLRSLPGLTPRVLIMRLNELEQCGLIQPLIVQQRPRIVRWVMTEKGNDTIPILEGYSAYVAKWHPNASLRNHLVKPVSFPTISELFEMRRRSNIQANDRLGPIAPRADARSSSN